MCEVGAMKAFVQFPLHVNRLMNDHPTQGSLLSKRRLRFVIQTYRDTDGPTLLSPSPRQRFSLPTSVDGVEA